MMNNIPVVISLSFIILTIVLIIVMMGIYQRALRKLKIPANKSFFLPIIIFLGLIIQAFVAKTGVFMDFQNTPPKLFILPLSAFVIIFFITRSKKTKEIIDVIPLTSLMYIQVYRIFVEFILWGLHKEQIIPVQMTFEGYNYDILSGILLPIVGYLVFEKKLLPIKVAIWANVMGIILLMTIIIIAATSTPSFIHLNWEDPLYNTVIGQYPIVWLPGFVAPVALFFHVLSIKQINRYRKQNPKA